MQERQRKLKKPNKQKERTPIKKTLHNGNKNKSISKDTKGNTKSNGKYSKKAHKRRKEKERINIAFYCQYHSFSMM